MDTIYLICLLVGGFFVALSLLGGGDSADLGVDADADVDLGGDFHGDFHLHGDAAGHGATGAGSGFIDLFSIRALFLFMAFFGLTGVSLSLLDNGEPYTLMVSLLVGILVGLGGNYLIRKIGYERVSSDLQANDVTGLTARVLLPFEGEKKGKISLVAGGQRLQLVARGFGGETAEVFNPGDEVVVVRMEGSVAEVVKPE